MAHIESRLGLNITDLEKNLTKATNDLTKFSKSGAQSLGGLTGAVARLAGAFGATASLAQVVRSNIDTAMNFESSMASLKALTGLGQEEMGQLKEAAIDLGGSTTQSASQVAEAFKLIGSAKPELLGSVSALKDVTKQAITLAEAAGLEVPDAARALTTSLNQFQEGSDQAGRYVNVLAAASQKGAGDINWLNVAITKSGTAAKSVGATYEQLVANLEQLAEGGLDASSAGTSLRSILTSLEKQSNSNLKPSVVGMTQAFFNMGSQCKTLSDYVELLGKENASAGMILAQSAEKANQMTTAITGTNTAEEQARINTDTLAGAISSLESAWEKFNLTLNDSNSFLTPVIRQLTDVVNAVTDITKVIQNIKLPDWMKTAGGAVFDAASNALNPFSAVFDVAHMISGDKAPEAPAESVAALPASPAAAAALVPTGGGGGGPRHGFAGSGLSMDDLTAEEKKILEQEMDEAALATAMKDVREMIQEALNGDGEPLITPEALIDPDLFEDEFGNIWANMNEQTEEWLENGEKGMELLRKKAKQLNSEVGKMQGAWAGMGATFQTVGAMMDDSTGKAISGIGSVMSAVSQLIPKLIGEAVVTAEGTVARTATTWYEIIPGIAAVTAAIYSAVQGFEEGGVIGGNSTSGDRLLIRANSGERVLTAEQNEWFETLANGGGNTNQGNGNGEIRVRIRNNELTGTLRNASNRQAYRY